MAFLDLVQDAAGRDRLGDIHQMLEEGLAHAEGRARGENPTEPASSGVSDVSLRLGLERGAFARLVDTTMDELGYCLVSREKITAVDEIITRWRIANAERIASLEGSLQRSK